MPTVFDRLVAAGLSQESIERHLTAGRVRVDGEAAHTAATGGQADFIFVPRS